MLNDFESILKMGPEPLVLDLQFDPLGPIALVSRNGNVSSLPTASKALGPFTPLAYPTPLGISGQKPPRCS